MRYLKIIQSKPTKNLIKSGHNARFSTKSTENQFRPVNMALTTYKDMQGPASNISSPLIVMHGLFGSKRNWNSLCKVFHQKTMPQRNIIAVDARNHGESPRTSDHSYPLLAEDIRNLYRELNINSAALLGHSMGGRAVMYFALRYPQMVDKLIVADISPVTTSPNLDSMPSIFHAVQEVKLPRDVPISSARADCDKQLSKTISDKGLRSFLLTNLTQDSNGTYIWQVNVPAIIENFKEHIAQFPDIGNYKFDGPVLFVFGENSDYVGKNDHLQILNMFPKAEFEEIKGAGHWLHSDKPNDFLKICLEFLNRNST